MGSFRVVSEGPLTRPLSGTVHVGGAKNSALKLMAAALLAPGPVGDPQRAEHPRRRRDGPAAAPARLHRRDRLPRRRRPDAASRPRAARRSRCRRSSSTRPPTSSYDASGHRSPCWVLSSPDAAAPAWPCPVATRSARVAWTCTSSGSRSSAPSYASSTGRSSPRCPAACSGANLWLDFPSVGRDREPGDGGRDGAGHHGHRQRGPRAGDHRPVRDARRDGRPDRRDLHLDPGHRGRRPAAPGRAHHRDRPDRHRHLGLRQRHRRR